MADRMVTGTASGASDQGRAGIGLTRELGMFSVLVFCLSAIGLAISGLLPFSHIAGAWPGSSLLLILSVALVPCVLLTYVYAVIGAAAPRSGADYYLARRVLSAPLAFASSWTFVIISAVVTGSLIAMIPQLIIPIFFRLFGMVGTTVPVMSRMAVDVASPANVVLYGTIFVIVTFLLMLLPPRVVIRSMQIGFFLILAAWAATLILLGSSNASVFPMSWDQVMGAGNYLGHLNHAKSLGLDTQSGVPYTLLAGLFVSFWIFYGHSAATSIAGEVKNPARSLLGGSLLALLLSGGIFLAAAFLMLRLVPGEWLSAESFLYHSESNSLSMPWIVFYAVLLRPNSAVMVFLFLAWVYSMVNMAQAFFFYCSRVILAWQEDGLMMETMGYLHPSLRSPLMAVLFVAILAEGGVVFASLNTDATSHINFAFFIAAVQLVPVLAVTVFPFTRREWFQSCGRLVRASIGPVPVITLVGAASFVYLCWLLVSALMTPVQGGVGLGTVIAFVVMFASGLAWYFFRKLAARSHAAGSKPAAEEPAVL